MIVQNRAFKHNACRLKSAAQSSALDSFRNVREWIDFESLTVFLKGFQLLLLIKTPTLIVAHTTPQYKEILSINEIFIF